MGYDDDYNWDDTKNEKLMKNEKRGYHIKHVAITIFNSKKYVEYTHPRYAHQSRAIGEVDGKIFTLAYEVVRDNHNEYIDLITYWDASKQEKELYYSY